MLILALSAVLGQAALPAVDGTRLSAGSQCYAIARGDAVIGATFQKVAATTVGGVPAWDIVIHQRVDAAKFDLRDHFIVRQADLAPVSLDSRKWDAEHVRVTYRDGGATVTRAGADPVAVTFDTPVWDGNLWGLTFAALPLAPGAHFELPFYQYDKGVGTFVLDVTGSETVAGEVAWVVETPMEGAGSVRYLIGKASHAELGYAGGPFAQRAGGDCSAISE